ncbi:hypothetical protein RCL_jg10029.t1 [Rhizophagus clarus]|uniref:Uncharacterized protein n=2 Tax=Rhizophagus clarus TaxID=94130 RepID=A0A8H3QCZ8_9GLOM|nr:hypothetical protein RCL_jg10029.t1 [Rhizophagus clarus]
MSTSILKTHYRRSATVLTSEQIEEIRHLKNKVPVYMIVKEYHINKNRVHDIWNDCERFQQNENHFLEELRKVQSISSVPPSENNPQEKENNHPISGSLDGPIALAPDSSNLSDSARTNPFHESIEINAQEKQKKKKKLPKRTLQDQPKSIQSSDLPEISAGGLYQNSTLDISHNIFASIEKDRIESEEAIRESEKLLGRNSPFNYIWTKNASQES